MFGGVGFLLNGNMLVGVRKDSLLVRLGPEQSDEALQEASVAETKPTSSCTQPKWGRAIQRQED
jgi:TfoX/Sxy family transcriptional regulator of competence genes